MSELENVRGAMNILCSMPMGKTTLNTRDVDYWLENFSDTVFCNGKLRQVIFDKITDNNYKVYTKEI